jgi:hypothetical protein
MIINRKLAGSILDVIECCSLPNPSSRTMAVGLTQPLTEVPEDLSGGKTQPARKADNVTAVCEQIV